MSEERAVSVQSCRSGSREICILSEGAEPRASGCRRRLERFQLQLTEARPNCLQQPGSLA